MVHPSESRTGADARWSMRSRTVWHGALTALIVASFSAAAWEIDVVDSTDGGAYSSIAIDRMGHRHIGYIARFGWLKYAFSDGPGWALAKGVKGGKCFLCQEGAFLAIFLKPTLRPVSPVAGEPPTGEP